MPPYVIRKNEMLGKLSLLFFVFALIFSADAVAGDSGAHWLQRETLTGDWGGSRNQLAEKGIKLDLELTEYYQGMFSGTGYDDFDTGGRADAFAYLDTEKLGLWKGGNLITHLTYRFGDLPAFRGGALLPVSAGSIAPLDGKDDLIATSLYLSQRFGGSGSLLFGKINALDLPARDPFFGGWGNHRFMNIAFVAPPSGVVPPVIMGAIVNYQVAPFTYTLMVFDPNDRTDQYWLEDLFSDGVNLSLGVTWSGKAFERASKVNLSGTYSTKDSAKVSIILLPPELRSGTKDGAFNVSVTVSHLLLESAAVPGQGLGLYGKAAIADGDPNPIQASFSGGFAGHHIVPGRLLDTFGIGYFYYDFSKDLRSAVAPLLNLDNEQGFEIFYNFAVTPWLRVTGDLQRLDPANGDTDHAWIGGLRVNMIF